MPRKPGIMENAIGIGDSRRVCLVLVSEMLETVASSKHMVAVKPIVAPTTMGFLMTFLTESLDLSNG